MAKYRQVFISFWNDAKVIEDMTTEDRYFFIYTLTNPYTTQSGIYPVSKKIMAFELGYSIDVVNSLIQRFENKHKIMRYNNETRELALKNWGKYNLVKGGKPIEDCIRTELSKVKDIRLIEYVAVNVANEKLKKIYYEFLDDTVHDTYDDTSTLRGQEEEKEEEKEEEREGEREGEEDNDAASQPVPYKKIQNLFNEICTSFSKVIKITTKRKPHIEARWKQFKCDIDIFTEVFKKVENSNFCKGQNNRDWKCSFDWLIQNDTNMVKVLEGKYDNRESTNSVSNKPKNGFHNFKQKKIKYTDDELKKKLGIKK